MYLGFSSEELSGSAISDYLTRVVQPMLSTVDGVASADILGGQTFAMRLWLDPAPHGRAAACRRPMSPPRSRANNFQAAAGQTKGYFIVSNITTNTDLTQRRAVQAHDGARPRTAASSGWRISPPSSLPRRVRMPAWRSTASSAIFIGVQATPQGNPLTHGRGRARAVPGTRTQPAAVAEDEGGLRLDQVHPVVDRRGARTRWSKPWSS